MAARRVVVARGIYAQLGGFSPLLANTQAQAHALEAELGAEYRCFIAMRYWYPLADVVVGAVKLWHPDEIILLPLYPQYSTTTTASSIAAWQREATRQGFSAIIRIVRSYPVAPGFIAALAGTIGDALDAAKAEGMPVRLLFSAHGLPLKIVRARDPYPVEVGSTAAAVVQGLGRPSLDWRLCYQSRVGPLAWLRPSVVEELHQARPKEV